MGVAGANVRTVRQQLGMSLRAVADAAGIDPATLSRIENGKQNLTEDLAAKVAKALNVSQGMLFVDPGVLEVSMLHMRKAPILTASQLMVWRGPDEFEEDPNQVYLHTGIETGSRHMFGFLVENAANTPHIRRGDVLMFDAKRTPTTGRIVLAQSRSGIVSIGQIRIHDAAAGLEPGFDVVPSERLFPEVTSGKPHTLTIRGVLAEQRRYFKP